MVKLLAALAEARTGLDRNIAFGEAVPRMERLRSFAIVGLMVACSLLTIGYLDIRGQVNEVRTELREKASYFQQVELREAQSRKVSQHQRLLILRGQQDLMRAIAGKLVASPQTTR